MDHFRDLCLALAFLGAVGLVMHVMFSDTLHPPSGWSELVTKSR